MKEKYDESTKKLTLSQRVDIERRLNTNVIARYQILVNYCAFRTKRCSLIQDMRTSGGTDILVSTRLHLF